MHFLNLLEYSITKESLWPVRAITNKSQSHLYTCSRATMPRRSDRSTSLTDTGFDGDSKELHCCCRREWSFRHRRSWSRAEFPRADRELGRDAANRLAVAFDFKRWKGRDIRHLFNTEGLYIVKCTFTLEFLKIVYL